MRLSQIIMAALLCVVAGCQTMRAPAYKLSSRQASQRKSTELQIEQAGERPAMAIADAVAIRLPAPADSEVRPAGFTQADSADQTPPEPVELPLPAQPLSATDGELTLERLEEIAMATNPTLAEAQARVDALRGRWVQAGLPPNTVIGYSGQQLGSRGQAEQNGVFLAQEVVRGGKLRLGRALVDQEIAVAQRHWETQRLRVRTDVHLGYYEVLVAQRRLKLLGQMVQISEEATKAADALLRAKEVSRADVLRARIELQANQVALKVANNQSAAAWSKLAAVLGVPDMPQQTLAADFNFDKPDLNLSRSAALERLLAESPELQAVLFDIERSRWAVARARAEGVPNLDVQGIIQQDNATGSSNGSLQVSMPIPWLNYNQGGIREAQSRLAAAELTVGRVELNLQRRMAAVFQRYASARDQVQDYSKPGGMLENAQTTLELVRQGYQGGQFGYLDMLTAQRTFAQTNLAYVEAMGELWAAIVEIDGLLLKDSLESVGAARDKD